MVDQKQEGTVLQEENTKLKQKKTKVWFYPLILTITAVIAWYSPLIVDAAVSALGTLTSFTSGETISSSDVNANFTALSDKVNEIVNEMNSFGGANPGFPDGASGDVVNVRFNDTGYTVPSGKNLYITSLNLNGTFQTQNDTGSFLTIVSGGGTQDLPLPIIIAGGKTIKTAFSTNWATITGFEASATVTPFHTAVDNGAGKTISSSQDAFILSAYNSASSTNTMQSGTLEFFTTDSSQRKVFHNPIAIKSNTNLTVSTSGDIIVSGYVK